MTTYRPTINSGRLQEDFETLAQIGATGDGGIHRPTFSEAHLQARAWFEERIRAAGLEFRKDPAGNHSGFLACGPHGAPTFLLGSHLDSVPNGGRFDGALGVLAALETLRSVREANLRLPVNLEAIDFTDEEGTLVGLLGSSALSGHLQLQDLQQPRGGRQNLLAGLAYAGLSEEKLTGAKRQAGSLAGYLELHIEQGSRLVNANSQIGVVTDIVGITSFRLTFGGRADHAGTTPMEERRDAAQGAGAFILATRQVVEEGFPECVANIGWIEFKPGAYNIVPEQAELALEFRSSQPEQMRQMEKALLASAKTCARRYNLTLEFAKLGDHTPTPMDHSVQAAIESTSKDLGLTTLSIASGAGHDAQILARLCPTGMIFIPSQDGASHSAREFSTWENCFNGANVLLGNTLRLARSHPPTGDHQ